MIEKNLLWYRLSLIKYIYENGLNEFLKPEPLCVSSLLMFHDAIELFMQLILEHYNIKNKNPNFIEYWELIENSECNFKLSQRESMKRLNNARVALKHHGTIPSKLDLNFFQGITTSFFNENCESAFNVLFSSISMIDLIDDLEVRANLKEAKQCFDSNENLKAAEMVTIAFEKMIDKYEQNKLVRPYRSIFQIGDSMSFISGFSMRNRANRSMPIDDKIYDFVDTVKKELTEIKNTIKIIGFGIDFRKYSKFKHITPSYFKLQNNQFEFQHRKNAENDYLNDDIEFCINFCIESYLKLISFDFQIQ